MDFIMRKTKPTQSFSPSEKLYYAFIKILILATIGFLTGCANTDILPYTTNLQTHSHDQSSDVTVTFLGNTTLYIKDVKTKNSTGIFIDAYISRPNYLLSKISNHKESNIIIDNVLEVAGIKNHEVDWVIPLHSHFDHLLDAPYVANKNKAKLIATPTTRNIAVSMGYDDDLFYKISGNPDQKITIDAGPFTIELEPVLHSDTGIAGVLFAPLARRYQKDLGSRFKHKSKARDFVEGQSYNVHITHKISKKSIYVLGGFPQDYKQNKELPSSLVDSTILFAAVPLFRKMNAQERKFFWESLGRNDKWVVPVHWDEFDRRLDIEKCQDFNNLENCLKSFFLLKRTMIKIDKEVATKDNVHLRWLTAFGKINL